MSEVLDFVPTRGSLLSVNKKVDFKPVVHKSYKKKIKKAIESSQKTIEKNNELKIDIHKSRHEIIKYGMSGFDGQKKEDAKIQLAIRLGARPPKNKHKNYKQLKENQAKEKEINTEQQNFLQLGKNKLGKSIAKGKRFDRNHKRVKGSLLDKYGTVTRKNADNKQMK